MKKITTLFSFLTRSVIEVPYETHHDNFPFGATIRFVGEFGPEIGRIVQTNETAIDIAKVRDETRIERLATTEEVQKTEETQLLERETLRTVFGAVERSQLAMRPISASLSINNDLVFINFSAEDRVDFRDLVRELSREFGKKVILFQIGPRDAAAIIGGHGSCGQKQCCTRFLSHLPSVTMDAARDQGFAHKGAEGLAGQCGKLKCCLNFEAAEYRRLRAKFPKFGTTIKLPDGRRGIVSGLDILNEKIKIRFEDEMGGTVFHLSELQK